MLAGLVLVPLAVLAHVLAQRQRRLRYDVRFTNLGVLAPIAEDTGRWRRHAPVALVLLALTALILGLARPARAISVPREQGLIVLTLDRSASRAASDIPPYRLEAARRAARSFVDGLPRKLDLAMVEFSSDADVALAPTRDRQA